MAPIGNNLPINNPTSSEIKTGNLSHYEIKKIDTVIENHLKDECHYCIDPLSNGSPLYIYNCQHIIHEGCHIQLINNGFAFCCICKADTKEFRSYTNATELKMHEGTTYVDESYNQYLKNINSKNKVINSELLQDNNTYSDTHQDLLERLESVFILLSYDLDGEQKQEHLFQLILNSNGEITPEIIAFLKSNNILFKASHSIIDNNNFTSDIHFYEPPEDTNRATQAHSRTDRHQGVTTQEPNSLNFFAKLKQKFKSKKK